MSGTRKSCDRHETWGGKGSPAGSSDALCSDSRTHAQPSLRCQFQCMDNDASRHLVWWTSNAAANGNVAVQLCVCVCVWFFAPSCMQAAVCMQAIKSIGCKQRCNIQATLPRNGWVVSLTLLVYTSPIRTAQVRLQLRVFTVSFFLQKTWNAWRSLARSPPGIAV